MTSSTPVTTARRPPHLRRLRLRAREWRLAALVLACLAVAVVAAREAREAAHRTPAGYRRIDDRAALQRRLRDGTLVRHEASFYHPLSGSGSDRP